MDAVWLAASVALVVGVGVLGALQLPSWRNRKWIAAVRKRRQMSEFDVRLARFSLAVKRYKGGLAGELTPMMEKVAESFNELGQAFADAGITLDSTWEDDGPE